MSNLLRYSPRTYWLRMARYRMEKAREWAEQGYWGFAASEREEVTRYLTIAKSCPQLRLPLPR